MGTCLSNKTYMSMAPRGGASHSPSPPPQSLERYCGCLEACPCHSLLVVLDATVPEPFRMQSILLGTIVPQNTGQKSCHNQTVKAMARNEGRGPVQSMGARVLEGAWAGSALPLGLLREGRMEQCLWISPPACCQVWVVQPPCQPIAWAISIVKQTRIVQQSRQLACLLGTFPCPLDEERRGKGWRAARHWAKEVGQEACPCPLHLLRHSGSGEGLEKLFPRGPPRLVATLVKTSLNYAQTHTKMVGRTATTREHPLELSYT